MYNGSRMQQYLCAFRGLTHLRVETSSIHRSARITTRGLNRSGGPTPAQVDWATSLSWNTSHRFCCLTSTSLRYCGWICGIPLVEILSVMKSVMNTCSLSITEYLRYICTTYHVHSKEWLRNEWDNIRETFKSEYNWRLTVFSFKVLNLCLRTGFQCRSVSVP